MNPHLVRRISSIGSLAVALALVVVPPASATIASSGGSPTKFSLTTTGSSTITLGGSTVTCTTWTLTGTIGGSSAVATINGTTWSGCTASLVGFPTGAATTNDTSGHWTFSIQSSLGSGSFSVAMTIATTVITASVCTITLPPQTLFGLTWTNTTKSLVGSVGGVSYTASGLFCPVPALSTIGAFAFSMSEPTLTVS